MSSLILIQEHTKQLIDQALEHSPHAILLSGSEGAGKTHLAKHFASQKLGLKSIEDLANYPYFKVVTKPTDKTAILIEQIRELGKFLQLKTPGKKGVRRIVIIENAELMNAEAQNALLKTLEEPPADTIIILTAPASQALKDTILSRVRRINVLPVSKQQAGSHFSNFEQDQLAKAYMMSGGLPGLMHALLHDEQHALAAQIIQAKELLAADKFTRLSRVDELSKKKEEIPLLLKACKLICSTALHSSAEKGSKQTKRWFTALKAVNEAEAALPRNPNSKLLLTNLMLVL